MDISETNEKPFMKLRRVVVRTATSRIFLTKVFVVLIFTILLFSHEGWEGKNVIVEGSLYLAGVALVAACLFGRAWSLSCIAGSKNSKLIMTGPYSLCRNPLYFSNFLGAVGLGLCTETLTLTLIIIVTFAIYYPHVIAGEEQRLAEIFGETFDEYRRSVPKFLPSIKGFVEEEQMLISVRPLRKGLRDLGALVLVIGLLEFVETLHKANVLPNVLTLY